MSITIIWPHLKTMILKFIHRPPNSCFVNNYFKIDLSASQGNMDIQSVFNEHKAIAYRCPYLSKSEELCYEASLYNEASLEDFH